MVSDEKTRELMGLRELGLESCNYLVGWSRKKVLAGSENCHRQSPGP
jgi:hypothetical protein